MNEEQKLALQWAIDQAGELENFHRRESEYYKSLPRSASDFEKAESYGVIKVCLIEIKKRYDCGE